MLIRVLCIFVILMTLAVDAIRNHEDWTPEMGNFINLPIEPCNTKADSSAQRDFAELRYLDMDPPCEKGTTEGYCAIRRFQNITFIAKFLTKTYNEKFGVRVHLVDKNFGFETAVWPEFSSCRPFFNMTCPQEPGIVNSYVISEIPREIPPVTAILRVRLISINQNNEKNIAICNQIKLQVI